MKTNFIRAEFKHYLRDWDYGYKCPICMFETENETYTTREGELDFLYNVVDMPKICLPEVFCPVCEINWIDIWFSSNVECTDEMFFRTEYIRSTAGRVYVLSIVDMLYNGKYYDPDEN